MAKNQTSFKKGQGGRKPGTQNKATTDLRKWITDFLEEKKETLHNDWMTLEPVQRIALFEKLLKYSLPALQSISTKIEFEKLTDEDLDKIIDELKK